MMYIEFTYSTYDLLILLMIYLWFTYHTYDLLIQAMSYLSYLWFKLWFTYPSGILTTWYKRVHTCLRDVCTRYVQCLVTAAYIHAMYKYEKSWTCTYMYIQCCQSMYTYVHGMYNVYTKCGINMYVHRSDMYVHVYTFMYSFWILWTCTYNVQTCILSVV